MKAKIQNLPLSYNEALRALLCMLPMLIASGIGKTTYLVPLGQGAFLFSSLFLPKKIQGRLIMSSLMLALGLGFYLIGGAVAPMPVVATLFTFLVCVNLSFLSGWHIGGPLALTLVMVYTAGLNTGSPDKASANFLIFAFVLLWSGLISLLPFWDGIEPPTVNPDTTNEELAEQGVRMGIGASIALAISYMAGWTKLGWAPSAVGNVVRYDNVLSKKRAWARFAGTLGGALAASIVLAFITDPIYLVWFGAAFAVLNGLFKKTKLGMIPLFYTATILILYTVNDLSVGPATILQRVFYNVVGITIGMLVVVYPFPALMKKINPKTKIA